MGFVEIDEADYNEMTPEFKHLFEFFSKKCLFNDIGRLSSSCDVSSISVGWLLKYPKDDETYIVKSAVEQLSTYKSVHLNKKNVWTHFIGVPAIIWSLIVFLSLIELPISFPESGPSLTVAMIFLIAVLVYYFRLHTSLAIGQLIFILPTFYSAHVVAQMPNAIWIASIVFVVAWIIQFIGHHYEKAKPAFVDDLNQLLIGPFFLMAEIFFMLGKLKALEKEITPIAIEKRRAFEARRKAMTASD